MYLTINFEINKMFHINNNNNNNSSNNCYSINGNNYYDDIILGLFIITN